ncbi:hypothetical protein D6827_01665 [Candidatus Parcubacteria bacterium]|nr:MAG: hypothetical protein D6827_01665 [Candidatus Parcubacteria bacterium]
MKLAADTKKAFDNGYQIAWDSTSIETLQTCPQKYYLSMVRGIKPKLQSPHLLFGGLFAEAIENYYKLRFSGKSSEDALRQVVWDALKNSFNREKGIPKAFMHNAKTRLGLIRSIIWYFEEYGDEIETPLHVYKLQNGLPAVELSFTIEHNDILFCGHLDRVMEDDTALYIMDQKTTGATLGLHYFRQFDTSNQMTLYILAGKILFDMPIAAAIIDAAQIAVNFTRFQRGVTMRSDTRIISWLADIEELIDRSRTYTANGKWPHNWSACGNYGGCPFRSLCTAEPKLRERIIEAEFEEHHWDPLEAR